jgi:hypothetical protein
MMEMISMFKARLILAGLLSVLAVTATTAAGGKEVHCKDVLDKGTVSPITDLATEIDFLGCTVNAANCPPFPGSRKRINPSAEHPHRTRNNQNL